MNANQQFNQQDVELFQMGNERTAARRQRREEMQLACVDTMNDPVVVRCQNLKIMGGAAARMSVGLVVLGGISRGLVDPGFAIMVAAGCALWAWGFIRRSRYGHR